jgi:uncharacterized lipoprotein YehR (DUF1307 family)
MRNHLILSATILALAACGKSDEKTITVNEADGSTATVTVSAKYENMTIETNEGKITIDQNGVAKFSDAAPQYPGSKITSTMMANSDGKTGVRVVMETDDSPAKVMAFYKAKMIDAKRPIEQEKTKPDGGGMIVSGYDKDRFIIGVMPENDKTTVFIMSGNNH